MTEPRKYRTMQEVPGDLVDDSVAFATYLQYAIGDWKDHLRRSGGTPVGEPEHDLGRPYETEYDNYEGHGWWWRLFHRHRVWTVRFYRMIITGWAVSE